MHARRSQSLAAVDAGAAISPQEVARNRRDVTLAAEQLRPRTGAFWWRVSGARSVYDADPLQALVRDVLTIGTHMVVSHHGAMVPYGRLMLGLPAVNSEA